MKFLRGIAFGLATILLYLGLLLLGWGLDRLGDFFADAARTGYALVVLAFGLAVGIQAIDSPEGIRGSRGDENKLVRRQSFVRVGLILLLYATFLFLPFSSRRSLAVWDERAFTPWLGVVLAGIGYTFVFLSGLALGRQYSQEVTIQKDHHLVTAGVFKTIRNPRYLGVIAAALGLACLFRSWVGLAVTAGVVVFLLFRIRDEEVLLHREFGQEWETYCRTSWRLIPHVY
jgi:protein-S-isoprenylcysteine O-methyltransferase Ste14